MDTKQHLRGQDAHDKANALLDESTVGMLVTSAGTGHLHVRPVSLQRGHAPHHGIWVLTDRRSRKVREISQQSGGAPVYLIVQNDTKGIYLYLRGFARVHDDPATLEAMWNPIHRTWFPLGIRDPNLVVLHLIPEDGEFWEAGGVVTTLVGLAKATLTGRPAETNTSGDLTLT